ncbi:MAG: HAD hydrolase-like protein, partial [Streptomycetales bacterium]
AHPRHPLPDPDHPKILAPPNSKLTPLRLAQIPYVIQSVLTGNTRASAEIKLRAFGLGARLDLDAGAYGNDHSNRAVLVGIARARAAQRYGRGFDPGRTVLIGDTPNDVAAAHRGGARVIAVATGRSTVADLHRAGADHLLPDLSDTAALVAAVLGRL